MDMILIKILAAFLALSLVTTRPDSIKTKFDPATDQAEVTQILRDGCGHMRKAFDVESIDIDDLIKVAMEDPTALSSDIEVLHGLKFDSLIFVYRQFCKNEEVKDSPVDLARVIDFFNAAMVDLPDPSRLKGVRYAGTGGVLDAKSEHFADLTESNRHMWVPLRDIPLQVQKAFIAAEDKRFYEHKGIDERGLVRAMVANLARPGRPQGGSTITQQVVKNLLVGDDVTYERKMREIIVAARLETSLSKAEILELYLNSIYLGRGAWGVELAARNYFGKPVTALTLQEGALLAGLPKGPTYYSPDRHPDRAHERLSYVLGRMQEDGDVGAADVAKVSLPRMVAYEHVAQRDSGYYFLDYITREARNVAGIPTVATPSTTVRTTIRPDLQRAAEAALQEGLFQYEARNGRVEWHGPEMNLADAVHRIERESHQQGSQQAQQSPQAPASPAAADSLELRPTLTTPDAVASVGPVPASSKTTRSARRNGAGAGQKATGDGRTVAEGKPEPSPKSDSKPAWQQALEAARPPLYDVHWTSAIMLWTGGNLRVGLADGRVLPLSSAGAAGRRGLNLYDVIFVKVSEGKGRQARAELRVRPTVEGATIVLDNKTGAILAMVGGFSYPVSQLNRVTQSQRQPGSSLKPFTYLAALRAGLQPNTMVRDQSITLSPIGNPTNAREKDYWSPKNDDGGGGGITTLRRGLENSKNLVTANLLDGGIASPPSQSLSRVCELTIDAQVYRDCVAYYPFVLGAQPARLIDMAPFYAAVATEGHRPSPYGIESIEQNGRTVYTHTPELKWLASGDRASFFQLRTMLQGVVARGTARAIGHLSSYVGGKTGTSDDENDAWFIGFTNDATIGVWVGYDNADGRRRTLGAGQTGGHVAVPIFEQIVEATWADYAHKAPLNPPSPEARKELVTAQIDLNSGNRLSDRSTRGFTEYFRLRNGHMEDTQWQLVSPDEAEVMREPEDGESGRGYNYSSNPYPNSAGNPYPGNSGNPNQGYWPGYQQGQGYQPPRGYYGGGGGGGFFQGGGIFGGLFGAQPAPQAQRPNYPAAQQQGQFRETRPRYSDDHRWAPPRRNDPDVPWDR
jgi:penicillin-binding protein 1A